MTSKKTRYSEWIRLDDFGILRVDVELCDCAAALQFLRMRELEFDCTELERRGEELTFRPGTTIQQLHAALAEFDELNSMSEERGDPLTVPINGPTAKRPSGSGDE